MNQKCAVTNHRKVIAEYLNLLEAKSGTAPAEDEERREKRELDAALAPFLQKLTGSDPESRRAMVDHVLATAVPATIAAIADRLARRLNNPSPRTCEAAAESLVGLGAAAAPVLVRRLGKARDGVAQVRLAEVIGAVAPTLPSPQLLWVAVDLEIAFRRAPTVAAAAAIRGAANAMRAEREARLAISV